MTDRLRVAVLISGRGSNLLALLQAADAGELNADIVGVLSNKAEAGGLRYAVEAGVDTCVISHQDYPDREQFDQQIDCALKQWRVDLVVLSGFMRVLGRRLVQAYAGRMINQHPSLLPDYPGLHTHQRALADGASRHGASVHYVIPELDAGPVLMQAAVKVEPADTPDALAARILPLEHRMIVESVNLIASGAVQMRQDGLVYLNGAALPAPLALPEHSPSSNGVTLQP